MMHPNQIRRTFGAIAIIIGGLIAAIVVDAPIPGALVAIIAGASAYALFTTSSDDYLRSPSLIEADNGSLPPEVIDLLNNIDEPLLIVRNRRVLIANSAARQILGEHIQGVDIRLAIRHPAAAERLTDHIANDTETPTRTELTGLGEHERRWEMTTSRLKDGSRLIRLADRSEAFASEQMRGDFVANASHELRTPLATLLGFLETLQDEKTAGDKKTRSRFLAIMFDEARRMHRLVDDLISLSRIEAERFTQPREPVDLRPLIGEVSDSCKALVEKQKSKIIVESGTIIPIVPGDRLQLFQLFQNLIVNALKYGDEGSPVVIRFEEAGPEMLRISIIDQGEGIAPEHLPRLTERFYRVDPSRSRAVGGTGLGLAIVKHIVGRHRGHLNIHSEIGKGTCIQIDLPRVSEDLVTKA
jgi:two-component system phosphate regulon sensor histidine kinase PhoR